MMTLWTLLACVADGAVVGAFFGGLMAYWKNRRSIPYLAERERVPEREWVRRRYIALLDRGLSAPFPERQMTRAR
jgi:uncharacterized iron-regulated membrane protein